MNEGFSPPNAEEGAFSMSAFRWIWLGLNAVDEATTQALTATGWAEEINPLSAGLHPLLALGIKAAAAILILHLVGRLHQEHPRAARVVGGGLCIWAALIVANTLRLIGAILA